MVKTLYPAAHLPTVRRLQREYLAAAAREERTDDLATAQRLALASDRVSRRLAAARNGITIEPPRTRRNLAIGALTALATIGRVIARALTRAASLRRASLVASMKRAARKVAAAARAALRRVGRVIAVAVASAPAVAAAHPGHAEHDIPALGAGALIVTAAVLAGIASKAWDMVPRRRAYATITAGDPPIPGGDPEPTPETEARRAHEAMPEAWRAALPAPYYTVRIPYVATGATEWHPTEPTGEAFTRGAFVTVERARAWADDKLDGAPYSVALVTARLNADATDIESAMTTVYTSPLVVACDAAPTRYISEDENAPEPDHRVICVGDGEPGDECEHTNEHGEPCHRKPRQWSIRNGSGYVVACEWHGRDLVIAAVEDGSIYTL